MNEARLGSFVKLVGLAGALIAAFTGIYQFWQSNLQNSRELRGSRRRGSIGCRIEIRIKISFRPGIDES